MYCFFSVSWVELVGRSAVVGSFLLLFVCFCGVPVDPVVGVHLIGRPGGGRNMVAMQVSSCEAEESNGSGLPACCRYVGTPQSGRTAMSVDDRDDSSR